LLGLTVRHSVIIARGCDTVVGCGACQAV
jgi:hypothetical protein